ncbi:hypothetical protein LCGC14_2394700 [marine sediment metagenome]|uniref:YspA cpYpsA-related SLOG domain-containing protein n=1 Tax=marine sediment metagenome TaxID=412755 RepID=A0A0F9BX41_9ZZZZ
MRVLVCGGREWNDPWPILRELTKFHDGTVVIHGAARGADKLAGVVAEGLGFEVIPVAANWNKHHRAAGPIRNKKMLAMKPMIVLAFHEDISKSKGTKDMVIIARKAGIETKVFSS